MKSDNSVSSQFEKRIQFFAKMHHRVATLTLLACHISCSHVAIITLFIRKEKNKYKHLILCTFLKHHSLCAQVVSSLPFLISVLVVHNILDFLHCLTKVSLDGIGYSYPMSPPLIMLISRRLLCEFRHLITF